MTVSNTTSVVQYTGNGATVNWPTGFRFFKNTDLVVTRRSVAGVTTALILNTDYSVTGANALNGGTVTTTNPLAVGELLTIARVLTVQQLTDLRNQGDYFAEIHEDVFDYLTMLIQQTGESDSRALRHPRDSEHYQAEARRIVDLEDPVDVQDATTKGWVNRYFGSLIDGATGLINTTTGILYDAGTLFDHLRFGVARTVDTISALRLLSASRNQRAFVLGYYARYDGGGGQYAVDQADTTTPDNGGSVIVAADGITRWKLVHNGTLDTAQFGCSTSLSDNAARFNAASNYVATFGGKLTIQASELTFTNQIFFKNGVIYEGRGVKIDGGGTKFTYTGTSDFALIQNPINGSTSANIDISGIWFSGSNLSANNGLLFDTASSVVVVTRCRFNSNAVGMILDQSELWDVRFCSFLCSTATSVGLWIVNGNDKNATSQQFFTNRLCFWGCEWNGAAGAVAVYDDGGAVHAFLHCNFNACGSHIIHTAVTGLLIDGGEYEVCSAQMFIQRLIRRNGNVSPASVGVVVRGAYFYNNINQTIYAATNGAVTNLIIRDCEINTPSGNVPFSGLDQSSITNLVLENNVQTGLGGSGALINNYLNNMPAIIGWTGTVTNPSIGNGILSARYDRRGKELTFRLVVEAGSTTTFGSGNYVFTLPFIIDSAANVVAQVGSAYLSIPGVGFFAMVSRVIPGTNTVMVFASGGTNTGPTTPGTWVNGTRLEFQIKCGALLPI